MTNLIAGLALALTFGGMTFFSAVMAPLVFTKLPAETAGAFIRAVFPWYYLTLGATTLVALLALLPGIAGSTTWEAVLTAGVLVGFLYARQGLMPRINAARDAGLAGDPDAGRRFGRLHRASVAVNGVQWLAVLVVLAMVLGILFLDEALEPSHLYALALILGGILASCAGPGRSRPTPADWTSTRSPCA